MNSMSSQAKVIITTLIILPLTIQADAHTNLFLDDSSTLEIGGRLHLDAAIFKEDKTPLTSGALVRRAPHATSRDIACGSISLLPRPL